MVVLQIYMSIITIIIIIIILIGHFSKGWGKKQERYQSQSDTWTNTWQMWHMVIADWFVRLVLGTWRPRIKHNFDRTLYVTWALIGRFRGFKICSKKIATLDFDFTNQRMTRERKCPVVHTTRINLRLVHTTCEVDLACHIGQVWSRSDHPR
jgi:hypothetical protein